MHYIYLCASFPFPFQKLLQLHDFQSHTASFLKGAASRLYKARYSANQQEALKSAGTYPVPRADLGVRRAGAGAEVEGLGGEAAMVEAHHVRPARRPVLHVAQIRVLIQLHVATTATQARGPLGFVL